MKARFTTEQPAVCWQPLDNGMVDVSICINGEKNTETFEQCVGKEEYETIIQDYWEYDFHQFREQADTINRTKVESNPEKYMRYIPETEKTLEQKVQEQAETIQMLAECMLEVSEMVYV